MLDDPLAWFYSEGEELETRKIVNAFGRGENVSVPKWCWRYYAWLKAHGSHMAIWTRELDRQRGDYPLGDMLHYALWCHACRTVKAGEPFPDFLPAPEGWQEFEEPDDLHRPPSRLN